MQCPLSKNALEHSDTRTKNHFTEIKVLITLNVLALTLPSKRA